MYTRADNFTGTLLYEDLKEAYLHPDAMKSLKRAQRLLKEQYPATALSLRRSAPLVRTAEDVERSERNLQIHLCLQPLTRRPALHNYGLAVDISILDDKGTPLPWAPR